MIRLNPESEWLEMPIHKEDGSDVYDPFIDIDYYLCEEI